MSQEQATKSVEATENQQKVASRPTTIHDALATEEIQSAFDAATTEGGAAKQSVNTSEPVFFREGLASAFALEEEEVTVQYEPPVMLNRIREFFAGYDFADRSDKTTGFYTVSAVYNDIQSCTIFLESQLSRQLSATARQQVMDDLRSLASFQSQAFDYMEEVRPTF